MNIHLAVLYAKKVSWYHYEENDVMKPFCVKSNKKFSYGG